MYIDKDSAGKFSIMEISPSELDDLACILFEFEHVAQHSYMSESERGRLAMHSAKIRFMIVDSKKL